MEFWQITPYELNFLINAYIKKQEVRREELISTAYYSAYFNRIKKLDKLDKYLDKQTAPKNMTDTEMLEVVKALNAMFGGEIENGE